MASNRAGTNWLVRLSSLIIASLWLKLFWAARGNARLTKRLGNRSGRGKWEQICVEKFIWKQRQSSGWLQERQRSWRDLKVSSEECEEEGVGKLEWSEDPARAEMLPSLCLPAACHFATLPFLFLNFNHDTLSAATVIWTRQFNRESFGNPGSTN